jgi:hypothetical protein
VVISGDHALLLHCDGAPLITPPRWHPPALRNKMPRMLNSLILIVLICAIGAVVHAQSWEPEAALVQEMQKRRPQRILDESKVPTYELPDPLLRNDGTVVISPQQWPTRREEVLEAFRGEMFGRAPGRPQQLRFHVLEEQRDALDGSATLRRILIQSMHEGRSHEFELKVFVPNASTEPVAVVLLICNRDAEVNIDHTRQQRSEFWPVEEMIARGYGMAAFFNGEVAPDKPQQFRDGVIRLMEGDAGDRPADAWAALAAWAWGASRALDYLETEPRVDATRVAIAGHSRGGKTALWAAAEDQRFALAISNNSGSCGAALSRRRYGETIAMTDGNPHWFADNFMKYNDREDELPFDQHMLIGLIAPRSVYVTSATEDLWADPKGEYLGLAHSSSVYALWDYPPIRLDAMPPADQPVIHGPRAYHIRSGKHDLTLYDWLRFADFTDRLWPK